MNVDVCPSRKKESGNGRTPVGFLLSLPIFLFCLLSICFTKAYSLELSAPLREASELLRLGRLDEARNLARSVQTAFPKDIQALLLLGMIDFQSGNFAESKMWFRLASAIDKNHPLVRRYQKLFQEVEHRKGPISDYILPLPSPDKTQMAEKFKKGWFGPNFTFLDPKVPVPPRSEPDSLGVATSTIGIIEGTSIDFLADEALKKGWYLKAYLLYKELLRDYPKNHDFLIGAAEAAIGMRRFEEARSLLFFVLCKDPDNQRVKELLPKTEKYSIWEK